MHDKATGLLALLAGMVGRLLGSPRTTFTIVDHLEKASGTGPGLVLEVGRLPDGRLLALDLERARPLAPDERALLAHARADLLRAATSFVLSDLAASAIGDGAVPLGSFVLDTDGVARDAAPSLAPEVLVACVRGLAQELPESGASARCVTAHHELEVLGLDRRSGLAALVLVRVRGAGSAPLTQREREIAALAIRGETLADIAHAVGLTSSGVKWHLENVYRKTRVSSTEELARVLTSPEAGPDRARAAAPPSDEPPGHPSRPRASRCRGPASREE